MTLIVTSSYLRWIAHVRCRVLSRSASASAMPASLDYDRDTGIISSSDKLLYQTVIGIEIHAQLSVATKLFSPAPTRHHPGCSSLDAGANQLVNPFDIAFPGTLPIISLPAVKASILSAASLKCRIHECSRFERKHYFYADLPHGYQITQQRWPLASNGSVTFMPHSLQSASKKRKKRRRGSAESTDAKTKNEEVISLKEQFEPKPVELRIERVQLEQDTGKTTTHTSTGDNGQTITKSNIDYNRAGCALIEIVSCPDLRSAHEAAGAVERIRRLLKHIGSCDGRMEAGSLRCDLNVSIAPLTNSESLPRYELPPGNGQRVEVKNLNSLRQIIAATEFEALRQSRLALGSMPTGRETRTFHVKPVSESYPLGGETFCIRAKGDAVDYRFMPEPDLPPLILDKETIGFSLRQYIERNMPEMPEGAAARIIAAYGLSEDVAGIISNDPPAVRFFEEAVSSARLEIVDGVDPASVPTLVANWLCNDLYALVRRKVLEAKNHPEGDNMPEEITVELSSVDGNRLGQLVALVANETLTSSMAKRVLSIMFNEDSPSSPSDIATANGWRVIKDMDTLVELSQSVVFDPRNASQLRQFKDGKKIWKIEKFFIGKIMAASKGNAHPELLKEALKTALKSGIILNR